MALLMILAVTVAIFAAIGRDATPARERLPIRSWGIAGLGRNVWLGLVVCSADSPLDRTMEEMFRSYR